MELPHVLMADVIAIMADGIVMYRLECKADVITPIIKDNIPHTPSKVGVLERRIFSHTPEEAMSVGLAKACVPSKN